MAARLRPIDSAETNAQYRLRAVFHDRRDTSVMAGRLDEAFGRNAKPVGRKTGRTIGDLYSSNPDTLPDSP